MYGRCCDRRRAAGLLALQSCGSWYWGLRESARQLLRRLLWWCTWYRRRSGGCGHAGSWESA